MVMPGLSVPRRSASSMSATASRSLTLPAGFLISSFATMRPGKPCPKRASSTSGVLPTVLVASEWITACRPRDFCIGLQSLPWSCQNCLHVDGQVNRSADNKTARVERQVPNEPPFLAIDLRPNHRGNFWFPHGSLTPPANVTLTSPGRHLPLICSLPLAFQRLPDA